MKRLALWMIVAFLLVDFASPAVTTRVWGRPTNFPLTLPIGGTQYQDWTITRYVANITFLGWRDYNLGTYTSPGHNGIDFALPNFAAMDAGVPVFAAADGTVSIVEDGEFDRCSRNETCTVGTDNFVRIEHASNIATEYVHLRRGSILVEEGEPVLAGQQIGFVGSSGDSSDAHLHFTVFENNVRVDTYANPNKWWTNPLPYAGNQVGALDHGITHHTPSVNELMARPSDYDVFEQSVATDRQLVLWANVHGVDAGDAASAVFFRPNGTQFNQVNWTVSNINPAYDWFTVPLTLPATPDLGTWRAELRVNGSTILSDTFDVVTATQTRIWTGASGNWSTAGNWASAIVPRSADNVRIIRTDGQARTVTLNATPPTLKSLTVDLTGPGTNRMTFNTSAHDLTLVESFVVGDNGRATFNQTGGRVTSAVPDLDCVVGFHAGGDGIYNLSGNGAVSVARDLYVGTLSASKGMFNQTGGTVSAARELIVGSGAGSLGTYNVSGGTISADEITVGDSGTGAMNISGLAQVISRDGGVVGLAPGSSGAITIDGPNAMWLMRYGFGILVVGADGAGTMGITGGASVSNVGSVIGLNRNAGASGSVSVSGLNSRWTMSEGMVVGQSGIGILAIQSGAQVSTKGAIVGDGANSVGTVVVDGAGSKWIATESAFIGSNGSGVVTVSAGGNLRTPHLLVNRFSNGNGTLTVAGAGSKVTVNGEMRVADEGVGLLQIVNGGQVVTETRGYLARNAPSARATAIITGTGSAWNLGESLTIGGSGLATLTVADGGMVSAPAGTIVNMSSTLRGNGTVIGNVDNRGSVAPGTSPGTLNIHGNYTQTNLLISQARLQIELASATSFDKLAVTGNITLTSLGGFSTSGSLDVSLLDGYVPRGTTSFDVLDWGGNLSGNFQSLQLPTLGGLLSWDTSQLTTGVLTVIGPPALPGDFNNDNTVNAGDYVKLRKGIGIAFTPENYNLWRAKFGTTLNPGSGATGFASGPAIPEPSTLLLLLFAVAGVCFRRHQDLPPVPKLNQV